MKILSSLLLLFILAGCAAQTSRDFEPTAPLSFKKVMDNFEGECKAQPNELSVSAHFFKPKTYSNRCKKVYTFQQLKGRYPFAYYGKKGKKSFNKYIVNRYKPFQWNRTLSGTHRSTYVFLLKDGYSSIEIRHEGGTKRDGINLIENMEKARVEIIGQFYSKTPFLSSQNFYGGPNYPKEEIGKRVETAKNYLTDKSREASKEEQQRLQNQKDFNRRIAEEEANSKAYVDFSDDSNNVLNDPNLNTPITIYPAIQKSTTYKENQQPQTQSNSLTSLNCSVNIKGSGTYCHKDDIPNYDCQIWPPNLSTMCPRDQSVKNVKVVSCERSQGTLARYTYDCIKPKGSGSGATIQQ